jgi:hypothetical protein
MIPDENPSAALPPLKVPAATLDPVNSVSTIVTLELAEVN